MKILESILDRGSFVETNSLLKNANVTGGYGTADNRLVYIYEQEGTITAAHAKKITNIYESALKVGAPVIGIFDSKGMELDEGVECFEAYAAIMQKMSLAKGRVPLISIVTGKCAGTMAIIASLSDFVVKAKDAEYYLQSPNTVEVGAGYIPPHIICENESECAQKVQALLTLLPSNYLDMYTTSLKDDLNRTITETLDVGQLIKELADGGVLLELQPGYTGISTALISCGGHPAGILAADGKLGASAFEKASSFVGMCDSLNIPIITLTNTTAYESSKEENLKLLGSAAKWLETISRASVPKINIILKSAAGGPYLLMNSKSLGADLAYAWQGAEIGILEKEASEKVLKQNTGITAIEAGEQGLIDDCIEPAQTRKMIIAALEMLYSKRRR